MPAQVIKFDCTVTESRFHSRKQNIRADEALRELVETSFRRTAHSYEISERHFVGHYVLALFVIYQNLMTMAANKLPRASTRRLSSNHRQFWMLFAGVIVILFTAKNLRTSLQATTTKEAISDLWLPVVLEDNAVTTSTTTEVEDHSPNTKNDGPSQNKHCVNMDNMTCASHDEKHPDWMNECNQNPNLPQCQLGCYDAAPDAYHNTTLRESPPVDAARFNNSDLMSDPFYSLWPPIDQGEWIEDREYCLRHANTTMNCFLDKYRFHLQEVQTSLKHVLANKLVPCSTCTTFPTLAL
jgi:hypothetical protein